MSDLNLSSVSGKAVQAATFARGAYDTKTPFVLPTGFVPLEVKLVNPQSPDFAASAYVNPKTGELVVAYRGSDSTTDLTTALKAAANGTWNGQFTDAAAYMKQAQVMAADAVGKYAEQENIIDSPKITTLATGHSLGSMLAQVVAKMYGVEAQVQDAPSAARLVDTPQFKQTALENGQPESGHDITGKIQNVTTSNIAKLGEQFQETQVVPIPALGQMSGVDALATLGTFLANPLAGLATGEALQTVAEHSSAKIEDALYLLAGVKGEVADAGALTLQTMFLDHDGKPVSYAPISPGDSSSSTWQIQALVDKSGKAIAFFYREVVDGEMQPVAVVVESGNRIHLAHAQDASSLQVIETTVSGERRVLSQSELLMSLQDAAQVQQARTSLAWLDANQDARLTVQDPVYAALKLWVDVNADGKGSATELQSLSQAGITAIDFSTNPPRIERADGSVQSLNVQTLTARRVNCGDLPGGLEVAASWLGFINALKNDNTGAAVVSGLRLTKNLDQNFRSEEIAATASIDAANDDCMSSVA
jgi:hypothetical protein